MNSVEKETERIARRISKEQTGSDALWELCLSAAYQEYYELPPAPTDAPEPSSRDKIKGGK